MPFKQWWDEQNTLAKLVLGVVLILIWPIGVLAVIIYFMDANYKNKFMIAEKNVEKYKDLPGFNLLENYSKKYAELDEIETEPDREQMLRQLLLKEDFPKPVVNSSFELQKLAIDIYRVKIVDEILKQWPGLLKNNLTIEGICRKCANDYGDNADNFLIIELMTHVIVKWNLGKYDDVNKIGSEIRQFKEELKLQSFKTRLNTQSRITMEDIDQMDGHTFEEFLAKAVLPYQGYNIQEIKKSCDQGGDIIAERLGARLVVQAKCYTGKVGNAAVQEVSAARQHYNCDDAWIITNSYFTKAAYALAKSTKVKLIDRDELRKHI